MSCQKRNVGGNYLSFFANHLPVCSRAGDKGRFQKWQKEEQPRAAMLTTGGEGGRILVMLDIVLH